MYKLLLDILSMQDSKASLDLVVILIVFLRLG